MTATATASKAHATVHDFATKQASDKMRVIKEIPVGKCVRQGDVYIKRINKPKDLKDMPAFNETQLAPGNTMGSRHMVTGDVKMFKKADADQFTGPVIVSKTGFTVTHPEHAHFQLPAGTYQVTYQLDWATQQRAKD
jgi:hypothetical protein